MQFSSLPQFFIVRVQKGALKDSREKDGHFYTHSDHVFMQRETQCGEIVSIGKEAQDIFPTAKIGHTLLFHHFVTGREMEDTGDNKNLLYSDNFYNYYSVTVKSHKGEKNLTYGIWDGETIIPHKDYIFLEVPKVENKVTEYETGLLKAEVIESREELGNKMKEIKNNINELTKTQVSSELTEEINRKEKEMNNISKRVNKKEILLYNILYVSDYIKSLFTKPLSKAGMLNIACNTKISFRGLECIVSETKYLFLVSK